MASTMLSTFLKQLHMSFSAYYRLSPAETRIHRVKVFSQAKEQSHPRWLIDSLTAIVTSKPDNASRARWQPGSSEYLKMAAGGWPSSSLPDRAPWRLFVECVVAGRQPDDESSSLRWRPTGERGLRSQSGAAEAHVATPSAPARSFGPDDCIAAVRLFDRRLSRQDQGVVGGVLHRDDRRLALRLHGSVAKRGRADGVDLLVRARDGACAVSAQTKWDDGLGAAVSAGLSGDATANSKSVRA